MYVTLIAPQVFPEAFAMPDPVQNLVNAHLRRTFPARFGFWKGVAVGLMIEVPIIAGSLWIFARLARGAHVVPFATLLRFTAVFCGAAAVMTAGGIGRLAARVSADTGRFGATWVAIRAHSIASLALIWIAALPHRHLPEHAVDWVALFGCGGLGGALSGTAIGLLCSGPAPVRLSDVIALAKKPGHALHELLDPDDIRQLGAALSDRTGNLLTGLFEPERLPPTDPEVPPSAPSSPTSETHSDNSSKP